MLPLRTMVLWVSSPLDQSSVGPNKQKQASDGMNIVGGSSGSTNQRRPTPRKSVQAKIPTNADILAAEGSSAALKAVVCMNSVPIKGQAVSGHSKHRKQESTVEC